VIAVYRAASSPLDPFSQLTPHPSSTLISLPLSVYPIPSTSELQALLPPDVTRLDCVVANAGGTSGFRDVEGTTAGNMLYDFEVNAVGPAELFRVCWPLMKGVGAEEEGRDGIKRFVVVSSSVGSIGALEEESMPAVAYGMSKAAGNWWAKKLSVDYRDKGLAVGIVHPG
jgi:NAD(P)-dependent dehydrogenase (short-subunit alcohol dehydrogenase family)